MLGTILTRDRTRAKVVGYALHFLGAASLLYEEDASTAERLMPESVACFRETDGRGLAQSVERAMPQVGHVALFAEPIAEPGDGERLAEVGHKEGQMPARCGVNDPPQLGVNWNF